MRCRPLSTGLGLAATAVLTLCLGLALLPARAGAQTVGPSVSPTESPTPSDSPTPTDTPTPTDSPTESPSDTPSPTPTDDPTPTPSQGPSPTQDPTWSPSPAPGSPWPEPDPDLAPWIRQGIGVGAVRVLRNERHHGRGRVAQGDRGWRGWTPDTSWGTYSTALLDTKAARLRKAGASERTIERRIYRPFIVEGPATWSDSWHAPRYAGGFHLHEGQDVLCKYGAPVLAAIDGRLTFGENALGGLAAYIVKPDGGFLYYAHLSAQRIELTDTQVHPGDVIGRCGATGDATVPHVHFGLYDAQDVAHDPMKLLVGLLHDAEQRAIGIRSKPNLSAHLPDGIEPEASHPVPSDTPTTTGPVVVYQAGVGIDGRAGPWDVLALIGAFGLILVPAGLMRSSRVRTLVGFKDEP